MILKKEEIQEEIKKLKSQRQGIVDQANQILGEIKGKIDVYESFLSQIIEEEDQTKDEEEIGDEKNEG